MSWGKLARWVALGLVAAASLSAEAGTNDADVVIPTVYESGHFYANPALMSGGRLRLLLDSGGGTSPAPWLSQTQARALRLSVDHTCELGGQTYQAASPEFVKGQTLPERSASCHGVIVLPDEGAGDAPGQMVPAYFAGGSWTYDYPGHQVLLRGPGWRPANAAHRVALGFKHTRTGVMMGWPRISMAVAGQQIQMLLDTGATARPTAAALKEDPRTTTQGFTVGSYIDTSMMNGWIKKHPDWKVLAKGDALIPSFSRMIRVPKIELAGWSVGPVWFIERPDQVFHDMMGSLMDRPPQGAIGANVFEHFQLTIDYPGKVAWFQCDAGCSASGGAATR